MKMADNDKVFKQNTSDAEVYSTSGQEDLLTMDNLVRKFPKVFSETIGKHDGFYRIQLDTVKLV